MFFKALFSTLGSKAPPIVLLMGGPGSGKSLLAKQFQEYSHVSSGELLRDFLKANKGPLATRINNAMQQGLLLNDEDIMMVLANAPAFKQPQTILLDGYPRTMSQWQLFKTIYGHPVAVIDLMASPDTARERLLNRQRADDEPEIIENRIQEYYKVTHPAALKIKNEIPSTLTVDTECELQEVHAQAATFLQKLEMGNVAQLQPL